MDVYSIGASLNPKHAYLSCSVMFWIDMIIDVTWEAYKRINNSSLESFESVKQCFYPFLFNDQNRISALKSLFMHAGL